MAHPYSGHKESAVGRRRVGKLLTGKEGTVKREGQSGYSAGAESGVGRLQKAANAAAKRK